MLSIVTEERNRYKINLKGFSSVYYLLLFIYQCRLRVTRESLATSIDM